MSELRKGDRVVYIGQRMALQKTLDFYDSKKIFIVEKYEKYDFVRLKGYDRILNARVFKKIEPDGIHKLL